MCFKHLERNPAVMFQPPNIKWTEDGLLRTTTTTATVTANTEQTPFQVFYILMHLILIKLYKIGTFVVFILQREKLRHREVTLLAPGHTTSEQQKLDLNQCT